MVQFVGMHSLNTLVFQHLWGDGQQLASTPHLSRDSAFPPLIERVTGLCPAFMWAVPFPSGIHLVGSLLMVSSFSFLTSGQG